MTTCSAITKAGEPCKAAAGPNGLCPLHNDPHRAKALGSMGGRKNRHTTVDLEVPEGTLTITDLRNLTVAAMRKLLAGELGAREATAFSQLCNPLSRMLPTEALEAQLASLQQQFAEMQMGREHDHGFRLSNKESKQENGKETGVTDAAESLTVLASEGSNGHRTHS